MTEQVDVGAQVEKPILELSEKDKKYLREIGTIVIEDLLRDNPDRLPDAILLPETSACPLVDLLEPVFERVSANRNTTVPKTYFIDSKSDDPAQIERIKADLSQRGITDPRYAIVDDYATIAARTINRTREKFGQTIPAYVFVGETYHYDYPLIRVGGDVASSPELRGRFDYNAQKVGAKFLQTGVNPVKSDMHAIGISIANTLSELNKA